ncbi:hypothetical protein NDU88_005624 [Pleurodeles waltl]|uniref:Uncharacterized protein n=1 Tax=Pleurodeles waltl TaxID=8319 RepID=A0AAV7N1T1_PLEWA|nr:hypothetical protein NDU88_005624 [Pleurodeles waltl]
MPPPTLSPGPHSGLFSCASHLAHVVLACRAAGLNSASALVPLAHCQMSHFPSLLSKGAAQHRWPDHLVPPTATGPLGGKSHTSPFSWARSARPVLLGKPFDCPPRGQSLGGSVSEHRSSEQRPQLCPGAPLGLGPASQHVSSLSSDPGRFWPRPLPHPVTSRGRHTVSLPPGCYVVWCSAIARSSRLEDSRSSALGASLGRPLPAGPVGFHQSICGSLSYSRPPLGSQGRCDHGGGVLDVGYWGF